MNQRTPTHEDSIGWLLNAAALRVNALTREALATLNLTQEQFAILKTLAEHNNLMQIDIARCVEMTADQMSRQIDALQNMGLLARHASCHAHQAH